MGSDPEPRRELEGEIAAWIRAARSGSQQAVGRLAEACRNYLLLVANRELEAGLRPKVAPSDLVQDTLLLLQQNIGTFRGESEDELLAWLRRILLNHLVDVRRRYHEDGKRDLGREEPLATSDSAVKAGIEPMAHDLTPGASAVAREQEEALRASLGRLPEDYRQVILLRNWDRLPFEEIGLRMNRSAEAVRKLWTRAIERLQQELDTTHESH